MRAFPTPDRPDQDFWFKVIKPHCEANLTEERTRLLDYARQCERLTIRREDIPHSSTKFFSVVNEQRSPLTKRVEQIHIFSAIKEDEARGFQAEAELLRDQDRAALETKRNSQESSYDN